MYTVSLDQLVQLDNVVHLSRGEVDHYFLVDHTFFKIHQGCRVSMYVCMHSVGVEIWVEMLVG